MMTEDVFERIEQFDPEDLTAEEREEFCRWWDNLDSATQRKAREEHPEDAMVADVATFDRLTAYRLTINANYELLTARRQLQRLKERVAGLEAANRFLSRELDRRFEEK